jgi:hypothetical protein
LGKPEGNGPLGSYKHRRDNTKINLKQAGWQGVDWIHPASGTEKQQAAVNSVMKHRVQQSVGKLRKYQFFQ